MIAILSIYLISCIVYISIIVIKVYQIFILTIVLLEIINKKQAILLCNTYLYANLTV